mgnify:CR=1 FL=1|jgi:hypothetical protein
MKAVQNRNQRLLTDVFAEYVKNLELYLLAHRERRFVDGNKYVDKAYKAAVDLRHNFGQEGRDAILTLLEHPDAGMRSSAASDSLDFATERATRVLEEVEKANQPFEGMAAQYCLKEWREGRKQFPGGPVTLEPGETYETS